MKNGFQKFSKMNERIFRSSDNQLKEYIFSRQERLFDWGDQKREKVLTLEKLDQYNEEMRQRVCIFPKESHIRRSQCCLWGDTRRKDAINNTAGSVSPIGMFSFS